MRRIVAITILKIMILWIMANLVGCVWFGTRHHESVVDTGFERLVVANEQGIQETTLPIEIETSGKYIINAEWETESEQLLTGYKLFDAKGEVKSYATGVCLWAEMFPAYYEKGEYQLVLQYMTNEAQIAEFFSDVAEAEESEAWYEGWQSCTEDAQLKVSFRMQMVGMSDLQSGYFLGALLVGVVISLAAILVLAFDKEKAENENAKHNYAATGLGLVAFSCIVVALQICYQDVVTGLFGADVVNASWYNWLQIIVPTYGFGFMVMVLLCKRAKSTPIEKHKLTVGQFICCVFMNSAISLVGALIGVVVQLFVLSPLGIQATDVMGELMANSNAFWRILTVGIGAPIFEELIFRKLLIDRVHKYGEGMAIVLSGLLFGLFHGNFTQVFYAAGLGLFFAYIYVRTGKVWYTIAFHMIINLSSAVISVPLMKSMDMTKLEQITMMDTGTAEAQQLILEVMPGVLLIVGWGLIMGVVALTGLILWIVNARKFYLVKSPDYVEKEKLKTAFGNFGMVTFLLLCVFLFVQYYAGM